MRLRSFTSLFIGFAIILVSIGCADETSSESIRVGSPVPRFSLRTADNVSITNRALNGQVVILNFWSTSCTSCIKEIPELQKIEDSSQATVIGIALDEGGWKTITPFVEHHGITYRIVLGNEGLFQRFNGYSIPYTLLLDRLQRIVKIYRGAVTKEMLEEDIRAIGSGIS
jgi:peroxiredoxin